MECSCVGCIVNLGIVDGYCRVHRGRANMSTTSSVCGIDSNNKSNSSAATQDVNDDIVLLRNEIETLKGTIKQMRKENLQLSNQVFLLDYTVADMQKESHRIKCEINTKFLAHDALNQYGRHENLRIYNIPEPDLEENEEEDCTKYIKEIGEKLNIPVTDADISRCHRLGKPRTDASNRPIICRFSSFDKKRAFIKNKKQLRLSDDELRDLDINERKERLSKNPFVTEDLTPFRNHIFQYIRNINDKEKLFDVVCTQYGQIVCKIKDEDLWYRISSPEDFLDAGLSFDPNEFTEIM